MAHQTPRVYAHRGPRRRSDASSRTALGCGRDTAGGSLGIARNVCGAGASECGVDVFDYLSEREKSLFNKAVLIIITGMG